MFPGFSQNMCNNMGAGYIAGDWQNWAADWTTSTLPQMEQSPLYNALNFDFGMWDKHNITGADRAGPVSDLSLGEQRREPRAGPDRCVRLLGNQLLRE